MFEKQNLKFRRSNFNKSVDISKVRNHEFSLPLVNAKFGDNGIMYYGREEDFECVEMSIDIVNDGAVSTGSVYAQPQKTGILYNAYLIKLKDCYCANSRKLLWFVASIEKSIKMKFGYENKAGWEKVKKHKIQLPTKNGEIDFDFMDEFVAELEAQRVAELEAYLTITGLKDYILTEEEEKAIQDYLNIDWKEYSIGDLFFVTTYRKRFDANKVTIKEYGEHPYIVRTSVNNGCRGFLDEDKVFLNEGNTISFGQDTATVFYQEKPYFTGDKIKILKCKFDCFEKSNAQFFITAISCSFSSFTWGCSSYGIDVIGAQKIQLPTKNGEIDFDFMETLTKAIQKLVIKDVVEWADKKISATKQVIKNKISN